MRGPHAFGGLIVAAAIAFGAGAARAQTDLGAGKTAAQLFAANCTACHRSAQGLARGRSARYLARFLLQHYTTRPANAGSIARYLTRVRPVPRVRPAARPPVRPPQERPAAGQAEAAARTPPPSPLKPLPKATVERLKDFVVSADAAKPSDGTTPARGKARIAAYAGIGVAAQSLRDTAVDAALRDVRGDVRVMLPERGPPLLQAGAPSSSDAGPATRPTATDSPESVAAPSRPAAATEALPRHGPPARGAVPSVQSNADTL